MRYFFSLFTFFCFSFGFFAIYNSSFYPSLVPSPESIPFNSVNIS